MDNRRDSTIAASCVMNFLDCALKHFPGEAKQIEFLRKEAELLLEKDVQSDDSCHEASVYNFDLAKLSLDTFLDHVKGRIEPETKSKFLFLLNQLEGEDFDCPEPVQYREHTNYLADVRASMPNSSTSSWNETDMFLRK